MTCFDGVDAMAYLDDGYDDNVSAARLAVC
jgi:hypothetical protein